MAPFRFPAASSRRRRKTALWTATLRSCRRRLRGVAATSFAPPAPPAVRRVARAPDARPRVDGHRLAGAGRDRQRQPAAFSARYGRPERHHDGRGARRRARGRRARRRGRWRRGDGADPVCVRRLGARGRGRAAAPTVHRVAGAFALPPVDGIVGYELLARFAARLDMAHLTLELELAPDAAAFGRPVAPARFAY